MGKESGGEFWVLHRCLRGAIRARNPWFVVGFMLFWPEKCQSVTDKERPTAVALEVRRIASALSSGPAESAG